MSNWLKGDRVEGKISIDLDSMGRTNAFTLCILADAVPMTTVNNMLSAYLSPITGFEAAVLTRAMRELLT